MTLALMHNKTIETGPNNKQLIADAGSHSKLRDHNAKNRQALTDSPLGGKQ